MPTIELSSGTIEYRDSGGEGPVLVMIHGLVQNGDVWRDVVNELRSGHRCITPTLPLGGHRVAMHPGADLSLHGQARLISEFLDRLDLNDVTLIANDWGGPQITAAEHPERLAALVLTSCETFDNIPPGLPGTFAGLAARIPGGLFMCAQTLRLRPLRRLPMTFGWMAKRPVPDDLMRAWIHGLRHNCKVRRDTATYVKTSDLTGLTVAAEALRDFDRPVLLAWAADDRIMPLAHAHRLAEMLPDSRVVEIRDSYTLIPLDQPQALATVIREFVRDDVRSRAHDDA